MVLISEGPESPEEVNDKTSAEPGLVIEAAILGTVFKY